MNFRKPSHSLNNGACVEVGSMLLEAWRKSSLCDGGTCVEVGHGLCFVGIRDTTQAGVPDRTVVTVPAAAWRQFTRSLKG